jgi:putative ATPase
MADVQEQPRGEVPLHLRDASYRSAASLGHGKGYEYPHDDPRGWVEQDYRPPGLQGRRYYEPSTHGAERHVAERLAQRARTEEDADERE